MKINQREGKGREGRRGEEGIGIPNTSLQRAILLAACLALTCVENSSSNDDFGVCFAMLLGSSKQVNISKKKSKKKKQTNNKTKRKRDKTYYQRQA